MASDPLYDVIAIYRKKRYWLRKYLFHAVTTYNGIAPRAPGMILPRLIYDDTGHDNIGQKQIELLGIFLNRFKGIEAIMSDGHGMASFFQCEGQKPGH